MPPSNPNYRSLTFWLGVIGIGLVALTVMLPFFVRVLSENSPAGVARFAYDAAGLAFG